MLKTIRLGLCLTFAAAGLAVPTARAQTTKPAARPEVGQIPEVYTTENSKMTVTVVREAPAPASRP